MNADCCAQLPMEEAPFAASREPCKRHFSHVRLRATVRIAGCKHWCGSRAVRYLPSSEFSNAD